MEIFNEYHKMYAKYLQLYKKFSKNGKVKTLTKKQHQLLLKLLLSDTTDTDDTQVCEGLLAFIEMMFGSKIMIEQYLKHLKSSVANKKLIKKIDALLLTLQKQLSSQNTDKLYVFGENPSFAKGFTKFQMWIVARKYGNYADYAINKAIDPDYKPKEPKTIATGQFTASTREELIDMFDSKNFYKLSNKQKAQLFQSIVNDYCISNGVSPCSIRVENLPVSDKSVCYGEYVPSDATIVLNKAVLESIGVAALTQNAFLPIQILSTLIHEAQHRVQFEKADGPFASTREMVVAENLKHPQVSLSHKEYLAELDELDARGAALDYIYNASQMVNNPKLRAYYNTKMLAEMRNGKVEIPSELKALFPDIYNSIVNTKETMRNDQAEYLKVLKSQQLGE